MGKFLYVKGYYLAANPFFDAFYHSDFLGRLIFFALFSLSIATWMIIIHKGWTLFRVRRLSEEFRNRFTGCKANILNLDCPQQKGTELNPFSNLFAILRKQTIEILNKNRRFGKEGAASSYLSPSDIDVVESHLMAGIATQTKRLEKNLYVLATVFSLAPFLGLLGTVWGILITFSDFQAGTGGSSQMILGGLSLALATTVFGLVDAIPALIGYNYFKNYVRELTTEMDCFSNEILASVEMQYRKVDVS